MLKGIRIEICAGSEQDVETASAFDEIDRIEYNSHLEKDGLTPDHDSYLRVREHTKKSLFPMVRVKEGPFTADDEEKRRMLSEAEFFLTHGADGIVFGILNQDGSVDVPFTKEMSDLIHSYKKEAVFHKAFDVTKDPDEACRILIQLHIDRVLTSGRKPSSKDGETFIAAYNSRYGGQIEFQPAGGVNGDNIIEILQRTGCTRFHMSLRSAAETSSGKIEHVLKEIRNMPRLPYVSRLTGEDAEMLENDRFEYHIEDQEDDHDHM